MAHAIRLKKSTPIITPCCTGSLALGILAASFATSLGQTISEIGRLPGGTWAFCSGISDDGAVVAGDADVTGGSPRAWRWTQATGTVALGMLPGADHSYGYAMSGNGLTVVGASGRAYDVAHRWTAQTGMIALGSLAAGQPCFAFGASRDGSVIVGDGYYASGTQRAFRWTVASGMQPLNALIPGAAHSVGLSVSADGNTTFGYCYNNAPSLLYPQACRWTGTGSVSSLGLLPATTMSVPNANDAAGSVAVGYAAQADGTHTKAFKWTAATGMVALPELAGSAGSSAGSVSGDGTLLGGTCEVGTQSVACIWNGNSVQDVGTYLTVHGVNTSGWTFSGVFFNQNGSVLAGNGMHNGASTCWRVSLGTSCTGSPTISTGPTSISVPEGSPVSFTVAASGATGYQWYHGSSSITGAIGPALTINAATQPDAGTYYCTVSNQCGSISSSTATLTVVPTCAPPTINEDPIDTNAPVGSRVELTISASGTGALHYQWQFNGNEMPGRIEDTLEILSILASDAGTYRCVVSDDCGSVTSGEAILTIPCAADFNADGGIDGADVESFFNAWEIGDASADVNGDGGVDGSDIEAFFLAWSAGGC